MVAASSPREETDMESRERGSQELQDARQRYSSLPVKLHKVSQITLWRLLPTRYIDALFKRSNIKNPSLTITLENIARAHAKLKPHIHNFHFALLSHTLGRSFGAISKVETPVLRACLAQHLALSRLGILAHMIGIRQEPSL